MTARVSSETAARVAASNIENTTKLSGWLQPTTEPLNWTGATVLTLIAGGLFYFAWVVTA